MHPETQFHDRFWRKSSELAGKGRKRAAAAPSSPESDVVSTPPSNKRAPPTYSPSPPLSIHIYYYCPDLAEPIFRPKFIRTSRTHEEHQEHSNSRIKLTFLYDSELEIKHIIYQNDEKNTFYNMESSKQSNKHVCKNSYFKP